MSGLSKKDVEILNLRAARMSSASIAAMVGWSEAKVYNRLNDLSVYSAADALDRLAGKSALTLAGLAALGDEAFGLLLKTMVAAIQQAAAVAPPPAPEPAVVRVEAVTIAPRPAPPRSAPPPAARPERSKPVAPRPQRQAVQGDKPLPVAAIVPPPPVARRPPLGAVRLKPVSPRVAAWAGHFRRARWSLAEVAHLFDVSDEALAVALGERA